jgi:hypothetical protein
MESNPENNPNTTLGGRRLPGTARIRPGLTFLAAPDATLADILDEACELLPGGGLVAVTAWASVEGAKILRDLTASRVTIEQTLVGVARGGTDRAALFAMRAVSNEAFVYLDGHLSAFIAHFKVYRIRGLGGKRLAVVGSANLTRGGLLDNEETATVIYDDGTASPDVTQGLDEIDRWIDAQMGSGFSHLITDALITTLIDQHIVPVRHPRSARRPQQRAAATAENPATPQGRRPYAFDPELPPLVIPPYDGLVIDEPQAAPESQPAEGVPPIAPRAQWEKFVRLYGTSESNRTRTFVGTHEFNFAMDGTQDQQFWGYPNRFSFNDTKFSDQRDIAVRFTVGDRSEVIERARVYQRLRDIGNGQREVTESRIRPLNTRAMRAVYENVTIGPDALLLVERGADVDFEISVILPNDPRYAALAPPPGARQVYLP